MSDVHNLVAEALKSGLSMDDILADFAKSDNQEEKDWHAKWTSNAASPKYQPGAGIKDDPSANIWPEEWKRVPNEVPWEGPAAVVAAGIGAWGIKKAAGSETGQKVIRSIKDRFFSPPTPTPDPFAGPVQTPGTALNAPAVAQGAPQPVTAQEGPSAEQIRVAKQRAAQASIEGRPVVSGAGPVTQSVVESTIAPAPVQTSAEMLTNPKPELPAGVTAETEVGKAPKDIGLVERSEQNKLSKEVSAAAPKGSAPAPENKVKKPAIPTFKTPSDIPEGMVFRPDVGNLDRGLVNILGPEGRLYAKDVLNEGKMFGHAGADYNQKVKELVGKYGEELKKITPSIDLTTREGRIAVGAPHTENYGSALGKAAKVGGVLGTLMTVAQSANAREAVGNVAESLLPIGMTPSELQSGKLTARQIKAFEEAQKLGSPYRSVPPPR